MVVVQLIHIFLGVFIGSEIDRLTNISLYQYTRDNLAGPMITD